MNNTLRWLAIAAICAMIAMSIIGGRGGPPVGGVAPAIEVQTVNGERFSLADQQGRVVVLDFWATWCGPCKRSLPALQRVHERYFDDARVLVASVNTDEGAGRARALTGWMKKRGFDFPVLLETPDKRLSAAYRVQAIPTMVVIGADGHVRAVQVGLPAHDTDGIERHIGDEIEEALSAAGI